MIKRCAGPAPVLIYRQDHNQWVSTQCAAVAVFGYGKMGSSDVWILRLLDLDRNMLVMAQPVYKNFRFIKLSSNFCAFDVTGGAYGLNFASKEAVDQFAEEIRKISGTGRPAPTATSSAPR